MKKGSPRSLLSIMLFLAIVLLGCASDHVISRPIIEQTPNWEMVESCGYEGCRPIVDFLSSKDIRIRIEAFNHERSPSLFIIRVAFVGLDFYHLKSDIFAFDPSSVTVKLSNGTILKPRSFPCSHTIWDLQYLRSKPTLYGQVRIIDNSCFLLFFDYPAPSIEEEFVMIFEGLTGSGMPVDVPAIVFKKGISRY